MPTQPATAIRSIAWTLLTTWAASTVVSTPRPAAATPATEAAASRRVESIYEATGVQGGLVVHIGPSGEFTAALRSSPRYLVEGLDDDPGRVAAARDLLHSRGLYGRVSVQRFDGQPLPYVDNVVNLLIVDRELEDADREVERVLCPGGVAVVREAGNEEWIGRIPGPATRLSGGFVKLEKGHLDGVDEWSHFLHDATGNAVAKDRRVGPPRRLRWVAGPRWCRSHEMPSSVQAVVMAGGRIFTIFDEGPTGVYRKLPQKCSLIARDAANGVLLWKTPLRRWDAEYGTGTGNRWNIHHTIPRRLVASGDRLYVTTAFLDSPVSELDAATGRVIKESLEGTRSADEMILSSGVLVVKTTKGRSAAAEARIRQEDLNDALVAIDVEEGKRLWRKENVHVAPYALSADAGRVVYHNLEEIVCLDLREGRELWRVPLRSQPAVGAGSTLVLSGGVVLYHGTRGGNRQARLTRVLTALSLTDGKILWERPGSKSLAAACTQPTDVFVVNGIVWCGPSLEGLDLRTGEVRKKLELFHLISPGHHYRCHRAKATERFSIWPKRGAEFVDLEGTDHMRNDWLRAPCFTGLTPAGGLLYVPPSPCFCYPGAKVSGFLALSADPAEALHPSPDQELRRGPAFEKFADSRIGRSVSSGEPDEDWPMHRRDVQRSGSTKSSVPADLRRQWEVQLAGQATQPVVVGHRLWVAEKDAHRVLCLDAGSGKHIWSYTAGGRIDSAPTCHGGLVLFGSRDGSVHCLDATDGALVWRFRAAPQRMRTVSYDQLESVWPIHGSVLVQGDRVYFAAGRSSFLDGGILVYALDVHSGRVLHHHLLDGPWPDIKTDTGRPFAMEGALPDLLVSDGEDLYMQRIKWDSDLNRLETTRESDLGELDMGAEHLVATGGFLDDTGFDRLYWMHSRRWPGFYFAQQAPKSGQLVVFDEESTYAVKYFYRRIQWSPAFFPAEHGYLLFADDLDCQPSLDEKGKPSVALDWLPAEVRTDKHRRGGRGVEKGTGYVRTRPPRWQKLIPLRVRAMVLAGDYLFVAGTPDTLDPKDPLAAFEGRAGARLHVFSTSDGSLVRTYPLPSEPAFDGLCAARGMLFLSTRDGKVLSYGRAADG